MKKYITAFSCLLLFLSSVVVEAVTTSEGSDGTSGVYGDPPQLDVESGKVFCSQSARGPRVQFPHGTGTFNACSSSTVVTTDICSTTPEAGGCPAAGTNSKIDVGWLPTSVVTGTHTHTVTQVDGAIPWPDTTGNGCGDCYCSGTGPGGPVTVRCGSQACGSDNHIYDCTAGGWVYEGTTCSEQTPSCEIGAPVGLTSGLLAGVATGTGTGVVSAYLSPSWAISGGSFGSGMATATATNQGTSTVTINVTSTASNTNTLYAQNGVTLGTTATATGTNSGSGSFVWDILSDTQTQSKTVTATTTTTDPTTATFTNTWTGYTNKTFVKAETEFATATTTYTITFTETTTKTGVVNGVNGGTGTASGTGSNSAVGTGTVTATATYMGSGGLENVTFILNSWTVTGTTTITATRQYAFTDRTRTVSATYTGTASNRSDTVLCTGTWTSTNTVTNTAVECAVADNCIIGSLGSVGSVLVFPNKSVTLSGTKTVTETDFGTTTPGAGKSPLADGSGKLAAGWIPTHTHTATDISGIQTHTHTITDISDISSTPGTSKVVQAGTNAKIAIGWLPSGSAMTSQYSTHNGTSVSSSYGPAWTEVTSLTIGATTTKAFAMSGVSVEGREGGGDTGVGYCTIRFVVGSTDVGYYSTTEVRDATGVLSTGHLSLAATISVTPGSPHTLAVQVQPTGTTTRCYVPDHMAHIVVQEWE